ncbi:MAG: 4'-phosphopantetheinyl transferase superfamily protein [Lachnospiraceae bacterium]|nr:4'-phosphopantetheinyl transferase superfamily protein [Lachnospiraceae bacterium]
MTDRIKVFAMTTRQLEDPEVFERYYQERSTDRREKIDRIRMPQDKRLSLAAGILLDEGLRTYALREAEVRVCKGEYGKPYFPDFPEIHFNLSHSGNIALAVFADREVGCDIEYRKRTNEALARRFFCRKEADWMLAAPGEKEKEERFYRIWTLKESFLKATGQGLHLPLNSFCFTFRDCKLEEGFPSFPSEEKYGRQEPENTAESIKGQINSISGGSACQSIPLETGDGAVLQKRRDSFVSVSGQSDGACYEFMEFCAGSDGEYCAAVCVRG